MKNCFLLTVMFTVLSLAAEAFAAAVPYDIAVIGGGLGGCSAAIEAARHGAFVAVIEDTDYLGGQASASGVSSVDDVTLTRTGIYKEFIDRIRAYYVARNTNTSICLWGKDTISSEPRVVSEILEDMAIQTGKIKLMKNTHVISCQTDRKGAPLSIKVKSPEGKMTIKAKIFIDATERGSFIPMTKAAYRAGASISPNFDEKDIIQDITYVAVIRKYDDMPKELRIKQMPPHYLNNVMHFRSIITKDGNDWPGTAPFNPEVHSAYRAIPDVSSPNKDKILGDDSSTYQYITHTSINWANDYPGYKHSGYGLSAKYLLDKKFRLESDRLAMERTLCFLYYMQNELGMKDWSVDTTQGYTGYYEDLDLGDLEPFREIVRYFPPKPYVRESLRIIGVETMTVADIIRNTALRRVSKENKNAVALGEYPTDLHGLTDASVLDRDLKENALEIPEDKEWSGGRFQIPLGALIPASVDNLLAAEKNISVSRLVNGSTRLHPVVMLSGQACGALASIAVTRKKQPRRILPIEVQMQLLNEGTELSIMRFDDRPNDRRLATGVEIASIYGVLNCVSENHFGSDEDVNIIDVVRAVKFIEKRDNVLKFSPDIFIKKITQGGFADYIKLYFKENASRFATVIKRYDGKYTVSMTRAELAAAVSEMLYINATDQNL